MIKNVKPTNFKILNQTGNSDHRTLEIQIQLPTRIKPNYEMRYNLSNFQKKPNATLDLIKQISSTTPEAKIQAINNHIQEKRNNLKLVQ